MKANQTIAALEQIRWIARAVRESTRAAGETAFSARKPALAALPGPFNTIGMAVTRTPSDRRILDDIGEVALGPEPADVLAALERTNLNSVAQLAALLETSGILQGLPPVLLGDPMVLLGLYRSLAAFQPTLWQVALPAGPALAAALPEPPFEVHFLEVGALDRPLDVFSSMVDVAGAAWRVPSDELLVALLAARVGDPALPPYPASWPHLAVALLAWRDRIELDVLFGLAEELDVSPHVHRGLAVVARLFPELSTMLPTARLEMPWWERSIALPIATRRLMKEALQPSNEEHGALLF